MAQSKGHAFGSQRWMTVPFEHSPKNSFDLLIDVLFRLQSCLVDVEKLIRSIGEDRGLLGMALKSLIESTMSQIDLSQLPGLSTPNSSESGGYTAPSLAVPAADTLPMSQSYLPEAFYEEFPTAVLGSMYDAVNLIIFSLLRLVSPSEDAYEEQIQSQARSIISASNLIYSNSYSTSSRGSLMMHFPLAIVSVWSSSAYQKTQALRILQRFDYTGGFSGVSGVSMIFFADIASYIHHRRVTN